MKILVEFYTYIKHRKDSTIRDHLRLLFTKTYNMKSKPKLSTIITINDLKYKVVKSGTSYRGKIFKHFIGVVKEK